MNVIKRPLIKKDSPGSRLFDLLIRVYLQRHSLPLVPQLFDAGGGGYCQPG